MRNLVNGAPLPPSPGGGGSPPKAAGWGDINKSHGCAVSPPPDRFRFAKAVDLPPQPKSDLSDFGHLKMPNSGKPEFGWGGGGETVP
jgi:hypothetical protein